MAKFSTQEVFAFDVRRVQRDGQTIHEVLVYPFQDGTLPPRLFQDHVYVAPLVQKDWDLWEVVAGSSWETATLVLSNVWEVEGRVLSPEEAGEAGKKYWREVDRLLKGQPFEQGGNPAKAAKTQDAQPETFLDPLFCAVWE